MRKFASLATMFLIIVGCNQKKSTSNEGTENQTEVEQRAIGREKDAHGCLVAAGESWIELKQGSIQIFNVGRGLDPIEVTKRDAEINSFLC